MSPYEPPPRHPRLQLQVEEALLMIAFIAVAICAGLIGWVVGHSTRSSGAGTVTVAAAASTAAASTATKPTSTAAATSTVSTSTSAATTTAAKPAASAAPTGGNPLAGKAVFLSAGRLPVDAKKAGQPLTQFVDESIVKPNAFIAPGYPPSVMPQTFASSLTKKQLADLVALLAKPSTKH